MQQSSANENDAVMSGPLTIIIPVYNEGANFPALWADICAKLRSEFTAFVIYDFDEDDTVPAVQAIIENGEKRLRLVKNDVSKGVVGAIVTGFNQVEHGPILVVMADLSDDLGQVDSMLALYRQGYHVVVGSRYMKGGKIEGGPWFKQLLSRIAGLTLYWFRGIPTHDATNAFKIYDHDMLRSFKIESRRGSSSISNLPQKRSWKVIGLPRFHRDGKIAATANLALGSGLGCPITCSGMSTRSVHEIEIVLVHLILSDY